MAGLTACRRVEEYASASDTLALAPVEGTLNMTVPASAQQIRLERLSPAHWRATFHHPSLSVFGPDTISHLDEIVAAVGYDIGVKVVIVLEEASEGFCITHCDFLAKLEDPKSIAPHPTGLKPLSNVVAGLSGAPILSSSQQTATVSFGPFCLHDKSRLLERDGVAIKLGSRAMDILQLLVSRAGEVVTKDELMAHGWPGLFVNETSLRVQIAELRKALGDGKAGARYIANVPSRGYCFVAPVQRNIRSYSPIV
jgi:DNA-binding winged helix-turn-helix (wHTH) protein